ncbi:hypothetical protein [Kitasatospora sp. NPDC093806]|uniref:hypothetical protein n=1 Tax=Kitasatospora sp. NPDC093806 TaxID=3155075 RepID=UPI003426F1A0
MELDAFMQVAGAPIGAAVAAYGGAVLTRAEDAAADATANLGRRIVQRVWRRGDAGQQAVLEAGVREAAEEPGNPDALAALRQAVRGAVRQDGELLRELAALLPAPAAPQLTVHVEVEGHGAVVNTGTITGNVTTRTVDGGVDGE